MTAVTFLRRPDELLAKHWPDQFPGRACNPGESESVNPPHWPKYSNPRLGTWTRWKNPGSPPGTPGSI